VAKDECGEIGGANLYGLYPNMLICDKRALKLAKDGGFHEEIVKDKEL